MGLWVLSCFGLFELAAASWIFGVFLSKQKQTSCLGIVYRFSSGLASKQLAIRHYPGK